MKAGHLFDLGIFFILIDGLLNGGLHSSHSSYTKKVYQSLPPHSRIQYSVMSRLSSVIRSLSLSSSRSINNLFSPLSSVCRCSLPSTPLLFPSRLYHFSRFSSSPSSSSSSNVDPSEIALFDELSSEWWNPSNGSARPLHSLNPLRIHYIATRIASPSFSLSSSHSSSSSLSSSSSSSSLPSPSPSPSLYPLSGFHIADIGCGGGLVSEPLARLGGNVLGIDRAEKAIHVAVQHAKMDGDKRLKEVELIDINQSTINTIQLKSLSSGSLSYTVADIDQLSSSPSFQSKFDAVCALEIIEHIPNPSAFISSLKKLLRPGGKLFISTINRTPLSFITAIVGAEYITGVIPKGTHQWDKFIRPDELKRWIQSDNNNNGGDRMEVIEVQGFAYNPILNQWCLTENTDINYMIYAKKPL